MSEHDEHSSFIKTPQQLVLVVLLAFLVPILGIVLLVQLVLNKPSADPAAMTPEAVAARIQPVGRVEFGAAAGAAGALKTGEEVVKATCFACHGTGAANAPKIGDKAAWSKHTGEGLSHLLQSALKGKGAMPPRGGNPELSDTEIARAIVFMVNQSGGNFKEPAPPAKSK